MLPVEAGQLEAGCEHRDGGQPARVTPGLQQEDGDLGVLGQPRSEDRARGAAAHDDIIPGLRGRVSLELGKEEF